MRVISLMLLLLIAGCGPLGMLQRTPVGTATSDAVCREIGADLPSRSRSDTDQTQDEIGGLYDTFAIVCPAYEDLIP